MSTKWHPTEAEAKKDAERQQIEEYKLTSTRVVLDERGFPRKWWRAVPTGHTKAWSMNT